MGSDPVVAGFEIRSTRYVAPDGTPVAPLPDWTDDRDVMVELYRALARTRAFDARAVALQRSGQLGTFASSLGQEAVAVGVILNSSNRTDLIHTLTMAKARFGPAGDRPVEILSILGREGERIHVRAAPRRQHRAD